MVAVLREGLEYVLSPSSPQGKDDRSSSHDLGEPFFKTPNSFIDIGEREPPMTRVLKSKFFGGGPVTADVTRVNILALSGAS